MDDKKKKSSYKARVGCWNCDSVYKINIKLGKMIPQHIHDSKMKCAVCGCMTLKMFKEYSVEKKIMSDVILHQRIEHDYNEEETPKNHDHYK